MTPQTKWQAAVLLCTRIACFVFIVTTKIARQPNFRYSNLFLYRSICLSMLVIFYTCCNIIAQLHGLDPIAIGIRHDRRKDPDRCSAHDK